MISVYVRLDKGYNIYQRQVQDLLTVIAAIGGLQKALFAIGMLLTTYITKKFFHSKIVSKVY